MSCAHLAVFSIVLSTTKTKKTQAKSAVWCMNLYVEGKRKAFERVSTMEENMSPIRGLQLQLVCIAETKTKRREDKISQHKTT